MATEEGFNQVHRRVVPRAANGTSDAAPGTRTTPRSAAVLGLSVPVLGPKFEDIPKLVSAFWHAIEKACLVLWGALAPTGLSVPV